MLHLRFVRDELWGNTNTDLKLAKACAAGEFSTKMWEELGAAGVLAQSWSTRDIEEEAVKDSAEMPKIGKSKKGEIQQPKRDMLTVSDRVCSHRQGVSVG
jgi:hypothetical protein